MIARLRLGSNPFSCCAGVAKRHEPLTEVKGSEAQGRLREVGLKEAPGAKIRADGQEPNMRPAKPIPIKGALG